MNHLTTVPLAGMPCIAACNASSPAAWSLTRSARGTLATHGIRVMRVLAGTVDTGWAAATDLPETNPAVVARAFVDGIAANRQDVVPDPMSVQVHEARAADHKAVENPFAAM